MSLLVALIVAATPTFTVLTCDEEVVEDADLTNALALEVRQTGGAVTRCGDSWRFDADGFEPVIVVLAATPVHLRSSTFALAVQSSLRAVVAAPPVAPLQPRTQLQADLGFRLFLSELPSALGTLLSRVLTPFKLWFGLELGLSDVGADRAGVRAFSMLGVVGARVLEVDAGTWVLSAELAAECGAISTVARSNRGEDYMGTTALNVMFGGWALLGFHRVFDDAIAVQFALRAGYDRGVRVVLLGAPALNLTGPFIGLQLGARF